MAGGGGGLCRVEVYHRIAYVCQLSQSESVRDSVTLCL